MSLTRIRSLPREYHSATVLAFTIRKETELVSLLPSGTIQIVRADLLEPTLQEITHENSTNTSGAHLLCISNDGIYAAVGSHDGRIVVYDLNARKVNEFNYLTLNVLHHWYAHFSFTIGSLCNSFTCNYAVL